MKKKLPAMARCLLAGSLVVLILAGCAPRARVSVPVTPRPVPTEDTGDSQAYRAVEDIISAGSEKSPAALEAFITKFPASVHVPEALMRLGDLYQQRGDLGAARAAYRRLLTEHEQDPLAPLAGIELLTTFYKEGDFENLLTRSEALAGAPFDPGQRLRIRQMRIDALMALGRGGEAADEALEAWLAADEDARPGLAEKLALAVGTLTPEAVAAFLARPVAPEAQSLIETLAVDRYALGCLLPLSGSYAAYGQRALHGIEMALTRSAADPAAPAIRLVVEDTGSQASQAVAAVRALAARRVAAIIGPMATAAEAAAEAQSRGIPIVTFTQRDGIAAVGDYVFRHFITARAQAEALVHWAVERRSLSRFAVLYPAEKYGRTFSDWFTEMVAAYGGRIVGSVAYDPEGTDFADSIVQLARFHGSYENGFQALFIPDGPAKAGLILPQLAFHDVDDVVTMGTNLWQSRSLIEMAESFVEGAIFPTCFFEGDPEPAVAQFVATFRDHYDQEPGFIEAVAYDTAMMLFDILSRPEVRGRSRVRDALKAGMPYAGLTGETVFDAGGEAHKSLSIIIVQDGQFVLLDRVPFKLQTSRQVLPPQ